MASHAPAPAASAPILAALRARLQAAAEGAGMLQGSWSRTAGLFVAVCALGATTLASLLYGNQTLALADVHAAYFSYTGSNTDLVILHLRVPRTLVGLVVGMALGMAGVLVQGITRNPLGGPGILGINAGAAVAAVLAITVLGTGALIGYVWFAFLGAALAAVLVYTVASLGQGGASPVKLAVAGAAVSAMLGSVTSAIILTDRTALNEYRFWTVGSLAGADTATLLYATPLIALGALVAIGLTRTLNTLALGDEMARSLGSRIWLTRALGGLAVVLLAGTATAAAGPIGFVGLAVPHVARAIAGPDYRWILPWTAVLAPLLLLAADILGRIVARPEELQVGIVTALVGAPFFIYLVRRRKLASL
ncbi:iron ABC transporter permease [Lipingzhangella sp. LS1_29]|uniref:Iron ABC transporter permease n=1 Tax=Lipingzhangella rawalii TaxID=2055835 RepID=A0ABU2H5M0_9ACTN|nr:iron ABC transporter permease [Lipingzhangella rawalii]MDS1270601.1 iron ABC transporter permease [Lipingzhangella rawalii]